jgi:hypothetical protein
MSKLSVSRIRRRTARVRNHQPEQAVFRSILPEVRGGAKSAATLGERSGPN